MRTRKHLAIGALVTAAALALAGCGSGSGERGQRLRPEGPARAGRLLHPAGRVHQAHQGVPGDARRQEHHVHPVLRRLRRPEPRGGGRPEGRRRRLLARAGHDPPGQGRTSSPPTGTPNQYKGMITDSVVVIGDPQGQPEEHQGLGRPDQARRPGHHAQPVHLGRRALEHHGRLRRRAPARAPTRPPASTTCNALFKNVPVQDDSARKSLQTFTGGKGDAFLSYENEAIFAQQNGQPVDYTVPDSDDPDREPGRGHLEQQAPEGGQGVPGLPVQPGRRSRSAPTTATGRSSRGVAARQVPDAERAVHHRRPRRLDRGDEGLLRHHQRASWSASRRTSVSPSRPSSAPGTDDLEVRRRPVHDRCRRRPAASAGPDRSATGPVDAPALDATRRSEERPSPRRLAQAVDRPGHRARHGDAVPQPHRAHPAGRGRLAVQRRRAGTAFWAAITLRPRRGPH